MATNGVVITQANDYVPGDESGYSEILYETYDEAETAYDEADKDSNKVALFSCNDKYFNRLQIRCNY